MVDLWEKGNQFSCGEEVVSFLRTSGRRRYRERWKKKMIPFFRETRNRPECLLLRSRFQEKWNTLRETDDKIPPDLPCKVTKQFDIAESDRKRNEEFCSYSLEDVLDTFPVDRTVEPRLVSRVLSEVGDYGETVRSLWWEASRDWNLMKQIGIKRNSRIWTLLDIDPDREPDIEKLIDMSLDFGLGQVDNDNIVCLARWIMGRMLVGQFLQHPYSDKRFISLEAQLSDGRTLGDTIGDDRVHEAFQQTEDDEIISMALRELPAAQREASSLCLQADSTEQLRCELGDKKRKAVERNFERALRRLADLRESGRLHT